MHGDMEALCAHDGCHCEVEAEGSFCSDACRRAGETASTVGCTCGHEDCQEKAERGAGSAKEPRTWQDDREGGRL